MGRGLASILLGAAGILVGSVGLGRANVPASETPASCEKAGEYDRALASIQSRLEAFDRLAKPDAISPTVGTGPTALTASSAPTASPTVSPGTASGKEVVAPRQTNRNVKGPVDHISTTDLVEI